MSIQLGSAYGKVALDVAGLLKGTKQGKEGLLTLATAGEKVGDAMKNVGSKLTIGLTLPIAALGAASIKAASDFEETKNKAMVVFDQMGDSIVANANRAASTLGVSKTQYLDYASSIGAALKAGGMSVKESADLASQAVKHFADLASFHNAQVEDVAAAWQSAIRGQYEPIQKYFPFITDSYLKTYGTANGLIDGNTDKLTANQRAIILNAIALDEKLNPAVNDFAETSKGLANSTRIMKAEWQDALVTLGTNLLPIALQVVHALNSMLEKLNQMSPAQQKMTLGFLGLLAIIGPVLTGLGSLISALSTIGGFVTGISGLGISFAGVGSAIGTVGAAIGATIPLILIILALLAGLALWVGIVYLAWKNNFLGMRDNLAAFVSIVRSLWRALGAFLHGDTKAMLEALGEAFQTFNARMHEIFDDIFGLQSGWGKFMEFLRTALGKVVSYISDVFTKTNWSQVGKYVALSIANGMLLGIPSLLITAAKIAQSVIQTIKNNLGIHSKSKIFEQIGMFSGEGYRYGLARSMSADGIANAMMRPVNQFGNSQQQTVTMNFASGLTIQQVKGMIDANNEAMMNTIIGALGGE